MAPTPSIDVRHLRKVYGEIVAVDDLTFSVPPGAVLGLLGGNGAGKTTTIAMLLGLLEPTAGDIQVLGIDMRRRRYAALPRMNFSSPYVDLPHRLTVRQNLLFYGRLYGVRPVDRRIEEIAAEEEGWAFVNVNVRPFYAEGSKTLGYEIAEQLGWRLPDQVVIPVASGSQLTKVHKAFQEIGRAHV